MNEVKNEIKKGTQNQIRKTARIRTGVWIVGVAVFLLLCAAAVVLMDRTGGGASVANVYVDGVCVRTVSLSPEAGEETFAIETDAGSNLIQVKDGKVRIASADCPDQVCVRAGWLTSRAAPIICLPHHLVIRLEGGNGAGTQTPGQTKERDSIDGISR